MKKNLPIEASFLLSVCAAFSCASPPHASPGPAPAPIHQDAADRGAATADDESGPDLNDDAGPRLIRPGAPGEESRILTGDQIDRSPILPHTEADIRFMKGMIPHHAQALDMAALVEERTGNREIHLLARRIAISQRDEIALMGRWLHQRGEEVPGPHAHHMMGEHLMPGMLTPEEMDRLARASGDEFDRLFLELMIKHHQGAITMVETLFASPGGGQETDIYTFAAHVDADQQIEIQRMRQMLTRGGYHRHP